jgi:hypothetical protein
VLNAILKLVTLLFIGDSTIPVWLSVLFIILGIYCFPLGLYQLVSRSRIKRSYRDIIHGDNKDLEAALDAAGGKLTPESVKIRHSLVVLDLAVTKLGITGVFLEDVPSIVLNSAVILLEMIRGTPVDESGLASFFALLLSCVMSGRKLGLTAQKQELKQKKMDLENLETIQEDMEGVLRQQTLLKAENLELEEEMRMKKHSEEELKVMVEALEAVSKERQDELREVMVDSKEVKIDKLLGKGG